MSGFAIGRGTPPPHRISGETPPERVTLAITASLAAMARVRRYREAAKAKPPRAAVGHMPFPGHRTQAQVSRGC